MYVVTNERVQDELLRAYRLRLLAEVEQACADLEVDGCRLADLDPGGTFVAALPWLFTMSARVACLDLTLWLGPAHPWGLRIRTADHQLVISAVRAPTPVTTGPPADISPDAAVSFPVSVVDELVDLWQDA